MSQPDEYYFITGGDASRVSLFEDFRSAGRRAGFWWNIARLEVMRRFRKTYFGSLWIIFSNLFFISVIGVIYAEILNLPLGEFFLYVFTGYTLWSLIADTLTSGTNIFVSEYGVFSQSRYPLTGFAIKHALARGLVFSYNLPILFIVLIATGKLTVSGLAISIVGFMILLATTVFFSIWMSIVVARLRDVSYMISNFSRLMFFVTPIFWYPELIGLGWRQAIVIFNPFHHYIATVRNPLLGREVDMLSWLAVIVILLLNVVLAMLLYRRYRRNLIFYCS